MRDRLRFFGLLSLFWLFYYVVGRLLFFIYHYQQTAQLELSEVLTPFLLGIRMDASMTGYWMIITGVLLAASPFLSKQKLTNIQGGFTTFLLILNSIILVVDLELYKHWGFRLDSTPLMYIGPEAAGSISWKIIILLLFIISLMLTSFFLLYRNQLAPLLCDLAPMEKKWSLIWLLITCSLIIPIRSSFTVAPLNTGFVYYHKTKIFPNHAGINPAWNFLLSISQGTHVHYPEDFYPSYKNYFTSLTHTEGTTTTLLSKEKPNIILIILESFTAKIIEPLGGLANITPELNALTKEGILFTNFYASGHRTDKGLVSILSGYPAQPLTSIIKYPNKTQNLPYLPIALHQLGYHSSFIYGGDIRFANMESYLTTARFETITDEDNFSGDIHYSKWGVADHYVFNQLLVECDGSQQPFFSVMLSLSSHEPFEVPMEPVFDGKSESQKFLNSCYYTDKSLGEFVRRAKEKEWWNNTLIIITADHGHRFPNPKESLDKERFKIPMLWLGGALSKKDTVINTFGSQTDIANTVLSQLGATTTEFEFSKNLMASDVKQSAVYVFNNGYGYVSPDHEYIYDFDLKNYLKKVGKENELPYGKAYMQKLFLDYNSR